MARKVLLPRIVSAEKATEATEDTEATEAMFEGFSKRAEEICRGTALLRYYFRKQHTWQKS